MTFSATSFVRLYILIAVLIVVLGLRAALGQTPLTSEQLAQLPKGAFIQTAIVKQLRQVMVQLVGSDGGCEVTVMLGGNRGAVTLPVTNRWTCQELMTDGEM